ncbi:MAG: hypothetical protein V4760_05565 [Bdellovibrionota bacterium]
MRKLLSSVLALSLAWAPLATHAQSTPGGSAATPIRASEYQKAVGNVVYSLDTLPEVINELRRVAVDGGRGITKTTSETIYVRLSTALELIHVVATDKSMTEPQRDAVQKPLFSAIGQAMYRVLRQHGNDVVQSTRNIDPLPGIDASNIGNLLKSTPGVVWNRAGLMMKEFLLDAKSLGSFVVSGDLKKNASADAQLVERIRVQDARRMEIRRIVEDHAKQKTAVPAEINAEIEKLNAQKTADERFFKRIWKPLERVNRVQTGERVIEEFGRIASEHVPQMEAGSMAQHHYMTFFAEKNIPKMITLRENRNGSQLAMKYFLLGMTVASFITPDFIGMVEGRSDWSRPVTSLILMGTFGVLTAIKGATIGTTIVKELQELLKIMSGEASYVKADRSGGRLASLKAKLARLSRPAVEATNAALAPVGLARGAKCPGLFL